MNTQIIACSNQKGGTAKTTTWYAKVKYNKPEELFGVANGAFHQAPAE